jgi:enoyl-[acyl-carrier protein] reductase III
LISLPNAVALVTGASRGIGRAIALKLAEAGSDVCLTYLNSAANAREVAEEVSRLGRRALVVKADLSEARDVEELCSFAERELGRLDVLVSNAAGGGFRGLIDSSPSQFDYAMRVNLQALMLLAQHAAPLLSKSVFDRAKMITMSSMGATRAIPMYGLIGAAKGAIESMTRHLALELGPRRTNVNCVRAGLVDTGALSSLPNKEEVLSLRRKRSLAGDCNLTPEDVAGAVLFLASPLADRIQGQTLVIDGGASLHA